MRISSRRKRIIISILIITSLCCSFNIFDLSLNDDEKESVEEKYIRDLNLSDDPPNSGIIHIDNNWSDAKTLGICTGNGTYHKPYVLENLVIDGLSKAWYKSIILIENTNEHFMVNNCKLYNSSHGIYLNNVQNGQLINNNCSNNRYGIGLHNSDNNSLVQNTANDVDQIGFLLYSSNNNSILQNTANSSDYYGIRMVLCENNTLQENLLNGCSLGIGGIVGEISHYDTHDIDSTNLVNNNPIYFYKNEINLGTANFTNAGQIIMVNCNDSQMLNLNTLEGRDSTVLQHCNNISISQNTADYNKRPHFFLKFCDNSMISNNIADIYLWWSDQNYLLNNTGCVDLYYSQRNLIKENKANHLHSGIDLKYSYYNHVIANNLTNNNVGITLFRSDSNIITNNFVDYNLDGIELLENSDNNQVSGNVIRYNSLRGIYLYKESDFNTITGNIFIGNTKCIYEINCRGNIFWDNGACMYGIPVDSIIFGVVVGVVSVISLLTFSIIRKKNKRLIKKYSSRL